jgi:hypothetical protein
LFSYVAKSGASQGSASHLNIFINDTGDYIFNSKYLLFADDLKINHSIRNVDDCKRLLHSTDSVKNWCLVNGMKLNLGKTMTIFSLENKQYLF